MSFRLAATDYSQTYTTLAHNVQVRIALDLHQYLHLNGPKIPGQL